jgi:hypothetical protein
MPKLTLLDIAKLNGNDKVVGLIEENLIYVPELEHFPVRQIKGLSYYTVKRTGNPSVSFRTANEGVAASKSTFVRSLVETFILSAAVECDKAVAVGYEEGIAALEMIEAQGVMKQAMLEIASQIWYGTSADTKGFGGIKAATAFGGATTLASGGSDANKQSSVYAVRFGVQDVTLIAGNGTTFDLSEFRDQQLADSNGNKYAGRVADLTAWVGLQIGNANCVGRIANVGDTTETGDTLTDAKIANLLRKFPVGYLPSALFMSRRSQAELQTSRAVVINSGPGQKAAPSIEAVADLPTSAFGIPIYVSDAILDTDAVES